MAAPWEKNQPPPPHIPTEVETMFRVTGPNFVAGFIVRKRRVVHSSPKMKYLMGWDVDIARNHLSEKRYQWTEHAYAAKAT
jgi:hypothetical protein